MAITVTDQFPGDGWGGAWCDSDGYFSIGDTDYSGAAQNITQSFSVPGGFDSMWVETSLGVSRLSGAWAHDPGPASRKARTDEEVPVPGFLINGTTPAFLTCFGIIDVFTSVVLGDTIRHISIAVAAVNQAWLVDNTVRVAIVLDLAMGGDTWSSVKIGTAIYGTAHKFGVVAAEPNETSPVLTIVPGLAALDRRGVHAQLGVQNTSQRADGEVALVAMPDAAVNPFAAYDAIVEGAAVTPDSALVAVWGPRTLSQASANDGDNTAINGELFIASPPAGDLVFPISTGKTVGDVRRG